MSLPPQIVRVKRKASEAPVEFLRVHETAGKRQRRANDFVFSRQQNPETTNDSITSSLAPHAQSVRPIKAIHRTPSAQSPATQTAQVNTLTGSSSKQLESAIAPNGEPVSRKAKSTQDDVQRSSGEPQLIAQPRRFHISRPQTSPSEPVTNLRRKRGVREEPVFVERRVRPRTSDETSTQNVPTATDLSMPSFDTATQPRTQKKPGLAKRGSIAKKDTPIEPKQSSPAPPPIRKLTIPSNYANTDEFLKQMQDYTLQEIGHSISQSKAFGSGTTTPESTPRKPQKSRFTPKKPALRFHERHPEMLNTAAAMDVDQLQYEDQEDTEDDSEYIIDTYIRIPAGSMEADDTPKDFGLLVLDSQPDIEEFYREHDDSEEEEEDEEEDENAENHYSADYPDEEVDTDDEYGRNAYNYRNYNASDLEEFDEDDATFSDEDNDDTKYPWSKKPLWLTRSVTEEEMKDEGDV